MAEKLFFKKIALGARLLFWHEETGGTALYISLKIPGSFSRLIFQRSSEWVHMEYPAKQKHVNKSAATGQ